MPLTLAWTPVLAAGGALLPLLVVLFVVISAVRAVMQAQRAQGEHKASGGDDESDRRAREIRERLRRVMEERRGVQPAPSPRSGEPAPRRLPGGVPPLEPFGGTLRRLVQEFAPPPPPPIPEPPALEPPPRIEPAPATFTSEAAPEKKPHGVSIHRAGRAVGGGETGQRSEARRRLLEDLRDPSGLRRAFVLREVLGPPVSQRGLPR